MEKSTRDNFQLFLDEPPEIDLEAAANWVESTIRNDIAEDNARYEEVFQAEAALAAELEERARQQDRIPGGQHLDFLIDAHSREHEQARHVAKEHRATLDEFGVLRQHHHVPGHPQYVKNSPYSTEYENQKDGKTGMSLADKNSGRMTIHFATGGLTSWEWASCSIAQIIKVPKDNYSLSPTFDFRLINETVEAWGIFCNADVELDIQIHTFNTKQKSHWRKRRQIGRVVNMWVGVIGQRFGLPGTFSHSGYGQADKGDTVIVTVTLLGRAKSPTGRAGMDFEVDLTQISIPGP